MKSLVAAWHDVTTWTITTNSSTPIINPWGEPIVQFALPIVSGVLVAVFSELIKRWLRDRIQKWKDGESKTPVVIKFKPAN
jgi:hypothetical protein